MRGPSLVGLDKFPLFQWIHNLTYNPKKVVPEFFPFHLLTEKTDKKVFAKRAFYHSETKQNEKNSRQVFGQQFIGFIGFIIHRVLKKVLRAQ